MNMIDEILKEISFREFYINVEEQKDDLFVGLLWMGIQIEIASMQREVWVRLEEEGLL